jgi:predicted metal-dependent RNase
VGLELALWRLQSLTICCTSSVVEGRITAAGTVAKGENPFLSDHFVSVDDRSARADIAEGAPCVIMATSGMLEGGPAIDYFKRLASDEKNTLIFVSYQIEGTLGRRVQRGLAETPIVNSDGKIEILKVNPEFLKGIHSAFPEFA